MPILPALFLRQDQMNDQRQQREQDEIEEFGFVCHNPPPALPDARNRSNFQS
jgi:hypothetical protein